MDKPPEKTCACSGIRSCLICEHVDVNNKVRKLQSDNKVKSLFRNRQKSYGITEDTTKTHINLTRTNDSGSNISLPCATDDQQMKSNAYQNQTVQPGKTIQPNMSGDAALNTGSVSPAKKMKTNSVIVNSRQKGNPIIKFIRNVPWEFGDIIPDYQLGQTSCALFLSLRYHHLNPDYIHVRLKQLGQNYALRVMLVQVDVKDPYHSLKELAKICILADCTLILAWSAEEAGRYLETYKSFENKPPDLIKEQSDNNFLSKLTDSLTSVKSVNKTDAMTLINAFGCFNNIVEASSEDLSLCPGFGPQKAQRLHDIFHQPFLKQKKNNPKSPDKESKQAAKS